MFQEHPECTKFNHNIHSGRGELLKNLSIDERKVLIQKLLEGIVVVKVNKTYFEQI